MSDVRVHVTDQTIIRALNTPGGHAYEFRDRLMNAIEDRAAATSPVNNPMNARHRGGAVGTYRRGWRRTRAGSGGHWLRGTVYNVADHAPYVEFGRSASTKYQRFSWAAKGGKIGWVGARTPINRQRAGRLTRWGGGTAARPGKHVLKNATNWAMAREGIGARV